MIKVVFIAGILWAVSLYADRVTLTPNKDNTLYESSDGTLSNGGGFYLFSGTTAGNSKRRALLHFDLSSIPTGSTLNSVSLVLQMDKTISGGTPVGVYRLLSDWGEANSVGARGEGSGGSAQTGDATWLHTFFPTTTWTSAGGDFISSASDSQTIDGNGTYTWASEQLKADVQVWIDSTASNSGWILIGDETKTPTSKRFISRDDNDPNRHPQLLVDYTAPASNPSDPDFGDPDPTFVGDFNGDNQIDFDDFFAFADHFGLTSAEANWDAAYDFDADGDVDFDDFFIFADHFGKKLN
ncbi:MAG: hypothetical protein ACI906_003629 [Candidatus Latescibacterota bacterium]